MKGVVLMKPIYSIFLAMALTGTAATAATITEKDFDSVTNQTLLFDRNTGAGIQQLSDSTSATNVSGSPLAISQFDPTLGMLNSISVDWNFGGASQLLQDDFYCRDSGLINSSCEDESSSQSASYSRAIDLPGVLTRVGVGDGQVNGTYMVAPGDFSTFIGSGSVTVPWKYSFSHSISGTCDPNLGTIITRCDLTGSIKFDQWAGISVTYDFNPTSTPPSVVPLPAGLPLLLAGLGLLGVMRRRR